MADSKLLTSISDRGVETSSETNRNDETPKLDKCRKSTTILFQIFCILWLVPITALLWLNFSNYIIGPSAWCPRGESCSIDPLNPVPSRTRANIARYNENSRNLLAVLQLVAKFLEIWFIVIAGALLFLVTMQFAGKPTGLPLGFLTRTIDFPGIKELFDPFLWSARTKASSYRTGVQVWSLTIFSILLALLCYLMGPATAILAIPTLQWTTTQPIGDHYFVDLNSADPPKADASSWFALYSLTTWQSAAKACNSNKFTEERFACTEDPLGFALDQWMDSALASHGSIGAANFVDPLLAPYTFTANATWLSEDNVSALKGSQHPSHTDVFRNFVWWVPSRQVMGNISVDVNTFWSITLGRSYRDMRYTYNAYSLYHDPFDTYVGYNKSLALEFQRNGPIVGFVPTMWLGKDNLTRFTLDVGGGQESPGPRYVRCYENYDLAKVPFGQYMSSDVYTKCIRIGSGWSNTNKNVSFTVPGYYDPKSGDQDSDVAIDIYSSDRAVFLHNGQWPPWFPDRCLTNETSKSAGCDWERLFDIGKTSTLANLSNNVITMEMKMDNGTNSITWALDFVAFYGFTTYILDPSRITNPTFLFRTGDLPLSGPNIAIDPAWLLAGWSVSNGEALSTQRTCTTLIQQVMSAMLKYGRMDGTLMIRLKTHILGFMPIAHAMSLIDHRLTTSPDASWTTDEHPLMQRNARMYVWGYFMGSRASILGVVVAIGGVVVVLLQAYVGFVDRRPYRDPMQLLASALKHVPQGEFDGKGNIEKAMARMYFQVEDRGGQTTFDPR